MKTTLWTLYKI